ncbi:MAG: hypothetical protein JOZ13_15635 [Alphaproteobacteria bacterium]|nr:hypothetical protein [Alphaproteobacteria bacterium]
MSTMELILHIGTEKTGTTSIQRFLRVNREALAGQSVLYPVSPGNQNHVGLTVSAQAPSKRGPLRKQLGIRNETDARRYRDELWQKLQAEAAERTYRLAVLSSEHLSSRLLEQDEIAWLRDKLSRLAARIRVVVYIRRQDDFLLSTYSTAVKSGATKPLSWPQERAIQDRYDHWRLLERWANIFGRENIVCRRFERPLLKDGDVVADFLDAAGIEVHADFERPEEVNEALDAESLEFLRLFNAHVPRFVGKKINPSRDNVVALLSRASRGALLTMAEDDLARFMALFHESNAKVAEAWFGGARRDSDNPLFAPRSDSRARVREAALTPERAVELCAWLWQEKQAQLARVAGRLERRAQGAGAKRKAGKAGGKRRRAAPPP